MQPIVVSETDTIRVVLGQHQIGFNGARPGGAQCDRRRAPQCQLAAGNRLVGVDTDPDPRAGWRVEIAAVVFVTWRQTGKQRVS